MDDIQRRYKPKCETLGEFSNIIFDAKVSQNKWKTKTGETVQIFLPAAAQIVVHLCRQRHLSQYHVYLRSTLCCTALEFFRFRCNICAMLL